MRSDDLALLLLRLNLGGLMIFHGINKLLVRHDYAPGLVAHAGYPAWLGYLVYVGELLAPLMLIFGVGSRLAGLLVMINMLVAFLLVHQHQLFSLGASGGWALELQCFYFVSGLLVALLGAGRYCLGRPGALN